MWWWWWSKLFFPLYHIRALICLLLYIDCYPRKAYFDASAAANETDTFVLVFREKEHLAGDGWRIPQCSDQPLWSLDPKKATWTQAPRHSSGAKLWKPQPYLLTEGEGLAHGPPSNQKKKCSCLPVTSILIYIRHPFLFKTSFWPSSNYAMIIFGSTGPP